MPKRRFIGLFVCAWGALGVRAAAASDPVADEELRPGAIAPGSIVWHPWPLFDPHLSPRETILTGGPVEERYGATLPSRSGFEATFGRSIETRAAPFFVRLEVEYGLRLTGGHWVLSFPRYTYAGGLMLGAVEVTGRFGSSLASVHFGSGGFGLGFLSPRASLGAAVRVGPVRVGLLAFGEYSWRWFGGSEPRSSRVDGFLVELSLGGRPEGLPPFYRIQK
jgi:hypothetical protein